MEATQTPTKEATAVAVGYGGAQDQAAPYHAAPTSQKAIWSLVCGIVGLCTSLICFGPVAICLAMQARKEIRNSSGSVKGDGLAIAGLVTGIISTVFGVIVLIYFILFLVGAAVLSASAATVSYDDDFLGSVTFSDDFLANVTNATGLGN